MEFIAGIGPKEIEVITWLMENRSSKQKIEFMKALLLGISVFLISAILYFMYDATVKQVIVLIALGLFCIAKAILCKLKKFDYKELAEEQNKDLQHQKIIYRFDEDQIISVMGKKTKSVKWKSVMEWGRYLGCIYIILNNGMAIILDEENYESDKVLALIELLKRKIINRKKQ